MDDPIKREALRLWREREMLLPTFARRMKPDDLDEATGAWDRMLDLARRVVASRERRLAVSRGLVED